MSKSNQYNTCSSGYSTSGLLCGSVLISWMETACVSMTVLPQVFQHNTPTQLIVFLARKRANIMIAGIYRKVLIGQNHVRKRRLFG